MKRATPKTVTNHSLLNRILQTPELVKHVQTLPAPALLKVVRKIGLEDSGELLALATTEQLTRLVDEDLWTQLQANKNETFDPERLGVWLSVLEELGGKRGAEKLSEMDEDFLAFTFSHYLHGIEQEALQFMRITAQGDSWEDQRLERILESYDTIDIGGILLLAKPNVPWDTIQSLLQSLDEVDTALCSRLAARLARVTDSKAEREGGLYEVLSAEELLNNDAVFSRHQRRGRDGYLAAEDARAFTEWLRETPPEALLALKGRDPVSRAYFREYEGVMTGQIGRSSGGEVNPLLLEVVEEEAPAPLLLEGKISPLAAMLSALDPDQLARFHLDLNFLAQVVLLTEEERDGPMRQAVAAERVIEACEKGLERAGPGNKNLSAIQLYGLGFTSPNR